MEPPINVDQLGDAISVVKNAIESASALLDNAATGGQSDDHDVLRARLLEAHLIVLQLQKSFATLSETKKALEQQVTALKIWDNDKLDYQFRELGPRHGVFAYAYAPKGKPSKPPHWLCPVCYNDQHKSELQRQQSPPGLKCPRCTSLYELPPTARFTTKAGR
jgi:hypothetical protein